MERLEEAQTEETIKLKGLPTEFQSRTVTLTYDPEDPEATNPKKDWGLGMTGSYDKNADNKGIFFKKFKNTGIVTINGELQQGDRIIEINGKSLLNLFKSEFEKLLEEAKKGESIKLKVLPDAFQSSPQPTGNSQSSI